MDWGKSRSTTMPVSWENGVTVKANTPEENQSGMLFGHPLSSAYPGSGSSFSREAQASFSLATSSSSSVKILKEEATWETVSPVGCVLRGPQGFLSLEHAQNFSPGRHPNQLPEPPHLSPLNTELQTMLQSVYQSPAPFFLHFQTRYLKSSTWQDLIPDPQRTSPFSN